MTEGRGLTSCVGPMGTLMVQSGYGKGLPFVAGACPACGARALFVGSGDRVTCSAASCDDPAAADRLLDPVSAPARTPSRKGSLPAGEEGSR